MNSWDAEGADKSQHLLVVCITEAAQALSSHLNDTYATCHYWYINKTQSGTTTIQHCISTASSDKCISGRELLALGECTDIVRYGA